MKINKHFFSFTLLLTLFCPVRPQEKAEEQNIYYILPSKENLQHNVTLEQAAEILKNFADNLTQASNFSFDENLYVVDNSHKALTSAQLANLTTLLSHIVNSAIATISNKIEESQKYPITQADAITLLHALEQGLVVGSVFTINGTTYTIVASH